MHVILLVTRVAVRRQRDLGNVLGDVTSVAIEAAVCPRQRIACLSVVIKAPSCPTIRIVAEPAIGSQAPLVMLVPVAGGACQRRILEPGRAVAFLACHHSVPSDQRKSRHIVIEGRYVTPIVLAVTLLATNAELAVMPIILAVAGDACCRELVAMEIARVARIAFHLSMCSPQRKFGLVVIEKDRGPFILAVAGFAVGAVAADVNVLNGVAVGAPGADALVVFADMACGARDIAVRTSQRELGLVMVVRLDLTPCRFAMTVVACFPQTPLMRIGRFMTIEAASGGVTKFHVRFVTAVALH